MAVSSGYRQAVHPRRGAAVECGLFRRRRAGCDALERIPQLGIAAGLLVRREITLEHGAVDTKGLDAGLDILAPRGGEFFRRRRQVALVKVEAERGHADTAELDIDVRAFGQFGDVFFPAGEDLRPPAGIGADPEHAANMVEDDRGVGKGAGEVDRVRQLRMVLPGFEAQAQRGELGEALAELWVAHQMRRDWAGREFLDRVTGVPRHAMADTAKAPAADPDLGLQYLARPRAQGQIGMADDRFGDAARPVTARGAHRGDA